LQLGRDESLCAARTIVKCTIALFRFLHAILAQRKKERRVGESFFILSRDYKSFISHSFYNIKRVSAVQQQQPPEFKAKDQSPSLVMMQLFNLVVRNSLACCVLLFLTLLGVSRHILKQT
jgi:hypothetical protein